MEIGRRETGNTYVLRSGPEERKGGDMERSKMEWIRREGPYTH